MKELQCKTVANSFAMVAELGMQLVGFGNLDKVFTCSHAIS